MLPSGFLAHILPPSIDSCWLGFRVHVPPGAIRALPFPLRGLHPLARTRSPVFPGCSAACRSRDSKHTRAANADWNVVLQADGAGRESPDWRNLMILVRRCIPHLEQELIRTDGTALLVYPGLLGRYDCLDVLERLRDRITSPGGSGGALRGAW